MDPGTMMLMASLISGGASALGGSEGMQKVPTMNKDQSKLLKQILQSLTGGMAGGANNQALGLLQKYLDPESDVYKNFEQPYIQQFEQETVPKLAEQFAGFGGGMGGGLSSSGFGQAIGGAGAKLRTDLAGMKSGLQRQSINDIMNYFQNMTSIGLGKEPFAYTNKDANPWAEMAGQFSSAALNKWGG